MCALVYLTFVSNLVGLMHDNLDLKYCRYIFACKVVFHRGEIVGTNLVNIIQGNDRCDSHNLQNTLIMLIMIGYKHLLGTNYIEVKDPRYVVTYSKFLSPIYKFTTCCFFFSLILYQNDSTL